MHGPYYLSHLAVVMSYDPNRHHRRSIRLQHYDYSQADVYFVTILVKNRACLLGEVMEGEMRLSEVGWVVQEVWDSLPVRYPGFETDAFVVMPNHVHGIIVITDEGETAARESGAHISAVRAAHEPPQLPPQLRRQMLLPKIIGYFKMNAARRANLILDASGQPFWQRNYYEHIIRDADALDRIRSYIVNNPTKWSEDQLRPGYPSKW